MSFCCINQHTNAPGSVWCTECDSLIAGVQIGDCSIVSYIRQGSSGIIYLAKQHTLNNRNVVLKVLRSVPTLANVESFRREAEILASLAHPYILPIHTYDVVEEPRTEPLAYAPYLVLPYAEQGSVEDVFEREHNRPWSLERVLPVIDEAAEALEYAHSRGILHRDVKPGNILLVGSHIMLSDFGVASLIDIEISHLSAPWAGSPGYMAPEVWQYHPGRYSDQYALAVTCFRLLTGEYPWTSKEDNDIHQWMHLHCHVAPCSLQAYHPNLPTTVDSVLRRAMAKDPHERYASVKAFARDLRLAVQQAAAIHVESPTLVTVSVTHVQSQHELAVEPSLPIHTLAVEDEPPQPALLERTQRLEDMPDSDTTNRLPFHNPSTGTELFKEKTDVSAVVSRGSKWSWGALFLNVLICSVLTAQVAFTLKSAFIVLSVLLSLWPSLLIGPLVGNIFGRVRQATFSWGILSGMLFGILNTVISVSVCYVWTALLDTFALLGGVWHAFSDAWPIFIGEAVKLASVLPMIVLVCLWLSVLGGVVIGLLMARRANVSLAA